MSDGAPNNHDGLGSSYQLVLSRDEHRTYQLCPGALFSIHRGDMDEDYMRALLGVLNDADAPIVTYVADVGQLGRVTNAARRLVARHPSRMGVEGVVGRVYLVNASVFARAAGAMLVAVGRLSSRRETVLLFRKKLAEAIEEATAFARETLG